MRFPKIFLMGITISALFLSIASAQTDTNEMVTISKGALARISPEAVKAIDQQVLETDIEKRVQRYGKFVGVGKEVGIAVNGALQAVNDQAVKFSETRLGKITIFIVLWKILFSDVLGILIGVPILIAWTILMFWILKRCFMQGLVVSGITTDGKKTYEKINDSEWSDGKWAALVATILLYVIAASIIIGSIIL